ncbi:ThuA domain-containing protein [Marinilongibacter aquaticus]|uniref:PVC-type heme-binding CxxCH protein n=1 Tax=Marinilongibacter aquaticus TaxID=2975157 RepID=UPI0021BD0A64|nr:PVC-type heme-binding CxxCH protein [Marinilongibacter aquaticus]UBM57186.1 ThuA domain-containing protein [Marinilongibacter aquaticus]
MKRIFLIALTFLAFHAEAQKGRRIEILFLGDSVSHHKPIERVPIIMAALGPKGVNFTYTDRLDDLNAENLNKYDGVMIYANYDEITPSAEKALLEYVASGKALLPIHCASYCFRNSPEYVKMVGGQFWRHTMDSIRTKTVMPNHPIMKGLSPFTAYDETYLHTALQPDNTVLAVRDIKADQAKDKPGVKEEPYTWVRNYGKGKVFYTAYGHDERTWGKQGFQDLIYNAILWAVDDKARAAFEARNPQPFQYKGAHLPNYEQRPGKQMQQLPLSPEESVKHIQVPVDFNLELFAHEPDVMHPIALAWDEKGRLYALITKDYPNERKPNGGSDYILRCEDTDGDGKADKFTRFAEGLSIPTGMVFANGGIIVTQAPEIVFLKDTDGDGKADMRKTLIEGFGTFDTHAGPSNLHYGFDNWIWGCVGYSGFKGKTPESDSLNFGQAFFRFKPDGSKLEWMTSTSNNTWGMAFNETNDVFGSTANNSHGWYMAIPHAFYNSKHRVDNGSRSTDTHRDMKPITEKVRQVDVFGGFTAASGHNFYTARSFPKSYWNQVAFVSEPTGHILHQNRMVKNGTDFSDKESFNLMAGADEWFSPVFSQVGPDGAVWVADWYSFIIQHNPTPKGFDNGQGNAYETNLRDFTHGRIYRVSYKQAPEYKPMALSKDNAQGLLLALKSDNMFWRMNAQRLLVERGKTDVVPQLVAILRQNNTDEIGINAPAIHALWTLKGLGALSGDIMNIAVKHPNADVRKNAMKASDFTAASVKRILDNDLLHDKEPLVVLNALLVLSESPLDKTAENAVLARLKESNEVSDRWLPDAFACVLTANNAKLMQKVLAEEVKLSANSKAQMNHAHHTMHETDQAQNQMSEGLDLVIESLDLSTRNPEVQERVGLTVKVKNQGKEDLPAGIVLPLDIRFAGEGLLIDQVSHVFKDGLKSGETASIAKGTNGPWTGDLRFYTDKPGEYDLTVTVDKANTLKESDKSNNTKAVKLTFSTPQSMQSYALQKALRSYSSLDDPQAVIAVIKTAQEMNETGKAMVYKALADGWNYKLKNVSLSAADKDFVTGLPPNEDLRNLQRAWGLIDDSAEDPNRKVIKIMTVREAMKFDLKEFTVKAGQTVELVISNPDAMQHNLVIGQQGSMEKVGAAADKMITDEKAAEKNYVPEIPEVLFSTPLINPDQTYRLVFKAPSKTGDYPFVCTFPGHWRLMNGTMKVIK